RPARGRASESHEAALLTEIYVDGDGCPVKEEVYRVAKRYGLVVHVVCNKPMGVPMGESIRLVVVSGRFDAADDWIAERAGIGDVVVTADIPLAARCLERGAQVLGPKGEPFTEDSIGGALASRELSDQLRQMGILTGGPAPRTKQDRSRFLSGLDEAVQTARRSRKRS
ncbi:MAG TPA: YaiI/YqxD family protein, partial [Thermoanaerobaculia bacterium]